VRGPGVVGQQPRLAPGEQFQYTSACPLTTPVGTMHGSFHMVPEDGEPFEALISPFRLAVPRILN
jgi:ApaG protein